MKIVTSSQIYNRLWRYSHYIVENGIVTRQRAHEKVDYIVNTITSILGNTTLDNRVCPYWQFSGCGRGYKMIRIPDKWTKTTVWCIAYEDIDDNTRVVRGIEIESVLASSDRIVLPPYQMRLPIDENRIRKIVHRVIREVLGVR